VIGFRLSDAGLRIFDEEPSDKLGYRMKMARLDELDRKIVRILQKRGDISQAELAEKVGTSTASCWRRLKSLEQRGVLGPVVQLVDPKSIGRTMTVLSQIRLKSQDSGARERFQQFVLSQEEVTQCFSVSGEWDYQLQFVVEDMEEFENLLMQRFLNNPDVSASSSLFVLRCIKQTTALKV
jgi:Lrp/AsnC family transcriptional regulator